MPDIFTKEKRSEIMSKVSSKETKPEIMVRKFLFANGFRFRKNDKRYPGNPDIVLPKYKSIIFVNGCFWHGHSCPAGKLPETRRKYWEEKIGGNIARDKKNITELEKQGWNVIRIFRITGLIHKLPEEAMVYIIDCFGF
jgi:DNA mismatch endonuclease (patch repair protein)